MSEPIHIGDLFKKEFLQEDVVDEELMLTYERTYRIVKRFCERNGIEWPVEFEAFRKKLYKTWERVESQTTDELIERCRKGNQYVKDNPNNIEARVLLASIEHRLKKRGYVISEVLKERNTFEEVFGDLAEEVIEK